MTTPIATIISIIAHRAAGNGIRQTAKLVGVSRATVAHWSLRVGEACLRLHHGLFRKLAVRQVEADELHTYVRARQRNVPHGSPEEHGDAWAYIAMDVVSRAIITFTIGKRCEATTEAFIADLRRRTVGTPSITTDGHTGYTSAIADAFGLDVNYTQVVKQYKGGYGRRGLRVASKYVSSTRTAILGRPRIFRASTSHVERLNATVRAQQSKFRRRAPTCAKSLRHLIADFAIFVAVYNLVDEHGTLNRTPACAIGVADHQWSLAELIEAALAEPEPPPCVSAPPTRAEPEQEPCLDPLPLSSSVPPSSAAVANREAGYGLPESVARCARSEPSELQHKVLDVLRSGTRTLEEMEREAFPELPSAKANSWVRNQLRGLRAMGLVEKVGRGTYQITDAGRQLKKVA